MKRIIPFLLSFLFLITVPGCASAETVPMTQAAAESPAEPIAEALSRNPQAAPIVPMSPPRPALELSPEEREMLLKIGMAERGNSGCPECIALVMCTIRNRANSGRFVKSIRSVLFAPEQFTPVMDGSYYKAKPNENCYDALDMVLYGWDESQGALYYEWCEGESWHSQNLHLLFQHCDIRFYD